MAQYFKKPSGVVIEVQPNHDINSLKERFVECDVDGGPVKKPVKKKKVEVKNG
tara:strand:+ start:399 stop:557 length:159 start_codon:yes stop_codon:yes gene_type:complete